MTRRGSGVRIPHGPLGTPRSTAWALSRLGFDTAEGSQQGSQRGAELPGFGGVEGRSPCSFGVGRDRLGLEAVGECVIRPASSGGGSREYVRPTGDAPRLRDRHIGTAGRRVDRSGPSGSDPSTPSHSSKTCGPQAPGWARSVHTSPASGTAAPNAGSGRTLRTGYCPAEKRTRGRLPQTQAEAGPRR